MNKNYFYFLTFSASLANFEFGYNIALFNSLPVKVSYSFMTFQLLCPAGAIFGCLLGCKISSNYGRRKCFFLLNLLNILGNLISLFMYPILYYESKHFIPAVGFGRFICGLAVGMASFVVPLYSKFYVVREMAPCEIYARLGSINQFMITFGIFIAYCSVFVLDTGDRMIWVVFGIPIFVSIVQILLFWKVFKVETPTFLISKNKMHEAAMLMNDLYYNYASSTVSGDILSSQMGTEYKNPSYRELFTQEHFKTLKTGCILSGLQQFTGINYLIFSSSRYLNHAGNLDNLHATLIMGAVNCVAGSFTVLLLKDRYKVFLQIGSLGMVLSYLVIISFIFVGYTYFDEVYFVCVLLFIVCFEFSIGPIMWIYCADVLSDRGISITSAVNWAGALLIGGIFSIEVVADRFTYKEGESVENLYFFFLNLVCMMACVFIWFYARYIMLERREILSLVSHP